MPKQDNEWLDRLIIENQSNDGSIDIQVQRDMRNEISDYISNNYIKKEEHERLLKQAEIKSRLSELEEFDWDFNDKYYVSERIIELNKQRTEL